jgi:hypothetical protein
MLTGKSNLFPTGKWFVIDKQTGRRVAGPFQLPVQAHKYIERRLADSVRFTIWGDRSSG